MKDSTVEQAWWPERALFHHATTSSSWWLNSSARELKSVKREINKNKGTVEEKIILRKTLYK